MTDTRLSDALRESQDERDAAMPATDDYTGQQCVQCGRIRVFLRRDGQYQCEKCDTIQPHRIEFGPRDVDVVRAAARYAVESCEDGSQRTAAEREAAELMDLADRIAALIAMVHTPPRR